MIKKVILGKIISHIYFVMENFQTRSELWVCQTVNDNDSCYYGVILFNCNNIYVLLKKKKFLFTIKFALTCCPYTGLIRNTTNSKIPNTKPYSVAEAPFISA